MSGLSNVYSFIDTKGNVTQIRKAIKKQRNKFYIDPEITFFAFYELCVIGITDEENGECSFGLALGMGDERSSTEMAFAIYD